MLELTDNFQNGQIYKDTQQWNRVALRNYWKRCSGSKWCNSITPLLLRKKKERKKTHPKHLPKYWRRQSIRENASEMGKWGELKFPWSGLPEEPRMETERIKVKTLSSFGVTSVLSCMRADSLQVVKETMPNFPFFPWSSQRCFPVSLIFDQMCLISVVLITFPKSGLGEW